MFAIVEAGGRQWKVEPGTKFEINRIAAEVGATHALERVLLSHDGQQLHIGRPYLEGAAVLCEVLEHRKGPKVISYYFRRRENWRKTIGHRQLLTRLLVKDVRLPAPSAGGAQAGLSGAAAAPALAATAEAKPAARKTPAAMKTPSVTKAKVNLVKRSTRKTE